MTQTTTDAAGVPAFEGPDDNPQTDVDDTGDIADPAAEDPDPAEITDTSDASFVDPAEVE